MSEFAEYKPEKLSDGGSFDIIKDKNLVCKVNSSLIDNVEGGVSERDGSTYESYSRLKYELEVISGTYQGRRFWKTFNLSSKIPDKKGKCPVHKLLDVYHTAGIDDVGISSEDIDVYLLEIEEFNNKFADKLLKVSAWGFMPENKSEAVQIHKIVEEAGEQIVDETIVPF